MAIPRNLANLAPKLDSSGNPTFTAPTVFSAGTASDPSITFTGDTNTGIFSPTADTIAFAEGGAEAMRIDSSAQVLVGTTTARSVATSNSAVFEIEAVNAVAASLVNNNNSSGSSAQLMFGKSRGGAVGGTTVVQNGDELGEIRFAGADGTNLQSYAASIRTEVDGTPGSGDMPGRLIFSTTADGAGSSTERARITSGGQFLVGKTADDDTSVGCNLTPVGLGVFVRSGGDCVRVNRTTSDGDLVTFKQDGTQEGSISVSGSTVSYNGGHLSRWAQMLTKPDLLKGTVMSNLDEMNVYIAPTTYWTEEDELPEGVNVGDVKVETHEVQNEQLNKVKVSDVEGDANVAGVFVNWDYDEAHQVDEINMAMTGDMIIRIAQGVTVARGDLLMSAGDGTAKPQGDDIVRSKTIAKVTSTHVTCTYEDGSYCVPCVLMAC
jgi:hypothetical protein